MYALTVTCRFEYNIATHVTIEVEWYFNRKINYFCFRSPPHTIEIKHIFFF